MKFKMRGEYIIRKGSVDKEKTAQEGGLKNSNFGGQMGGGPGKKSKRFWRDKR